MCSGGKYEKLSQFHIKQNLKDLQMFSKLDNYLNNAIFASFTLCNLINDLLDSAKLETSTFTLNNEYFNLYEVILQAFQIVRF